MKKFILLGLMFCCVHLSAQIEVKIMDASLQEVQQLAQKLGKMTIDGDEIILYDGEDNVIAKCPLVNQTKMSIDCDANVLTINGQSYSIESDLSLIERDKIKIGVDNNQLLISGIEKGDLIQIYTIQGTSVMRFNAFGDTSLIDLNSIPVGVNIIIIKNSIFKLVKD